MPPSSEVFDEELLAPAGKLAAAERSAWSSGWPVPEIRLNRPGCDRWRHVEAARIAYEGTPMNRRLTLSSVEP